MESKDYTYKDVINFTSVDDMRSTLKYYNKPRNLEFLKRSLEFESEYKNRSAVIKMLKASIRHIEKNQKKIQKHIEKRDMKCKISAPGCVYHACMSDDCQKAAVFDNGHDWGSGLCERGSVITTKDLQEIDEARAEKK